MPNRRAFLGSLIAIGATPLLAQPRFRDNPFTLGVASGYPRPEGMVLWTRLIGDLGPAPIPVRWEIADDEAMRTIVASRAEQSRNHHARRYGAANFAVSVARQREIHIMDEEAAWESGGGEFRCEPRGVLRGDFQDRVQCGVGHIVRGLEPIIDRGGEVLGKRDRGQAVEGAFPCAGDCAARDDEAERGVEADVDAADDGVDVQVGRQEVADRDVDRVARRAVDDPSRAAEMIFSIL